MFGVGKIFYIYFFKEINNFVQQGYIKLIKRQ